MSAFDRAEHCRRIAAAGGRATLARHGTAHYSTIGKLGFAQAVALGWGLELAAKLQHSYIAKYGRPIVLGAASRRKAKIRAEARRFYAGMSCDRCHAPNGEVHHLHINAEDPNQGGYILVLCEGCHRAEHRALRLAHLRARSQGGR